MAEQGARSSTCKNCNYRFAEGQPSEYCPKCGQENSEQLVSVGRFLSDLANNYITFDSKLLRTLKALLFWPGWLSAEYCRGKVASYVLPIRLYLLASLIYFTLFSININSLVDVQKAESALNNWVIEDDGKIVNVKDSLNAALQIKGVNLPPDSAVINIQNQEISWKRVNELVVKYNTEQALDSLKTEYPLFNNPLATQIARQSIKIYKGNLNDFLHYFIGSLPITMLLLMPLLALVFKLLYIRRKRYFVEHLTFFLHIHTFAYILLATYILIWGLHASAFSKILPFILLLYLFVSMKQMYKQGWIKTLVKQFIFLVFFYPLFLAVFATGTLAVSFFLF